MYADEIDLVEKWCMHADEIFLVAIQDSSEVVLPRDTPDAWTCLENLMGASRQENREEDTLGVSLSIAYLPRKPPVLGDEIWLRLHSEKLSPKALWMSEEQQKTWWLLAQEVNMSPCLCQFLLPCHSQESAKWLVCHR